VNAYNKVINTFWDRAREAVDNLAANLGDSPVNAETDCDLGPVLDAIRRGESAEHQGDLLRYAAEKARDEAHSAGFREGLAAQEARAQRVEEELAEWVGQHGCKCGHPACKLCRDTKAAKALLDPCERCERGLGHEGYPCPRGQL
jgi:hypothetical protein